MDHEALQRLESHGLQTPFPTYIDATDQTMLNTAQVHLDEQAMDLVKHLIATGPPTLKEVLIAQVPSTKTMSDSKLGDVQMVPQLPQETFELVGEYARSLRHFTDEEAAGPGYDATTTTTTPTPSGGQGPPRLTTPVMICIGSPRDTQRILTLNSRLNPDGTVTPLGDEPPSDPVLDILAETGRLMAPVCLAGEAGLMHPNPPKNVAFGTQVNLTTVRSPYVFHLLRFKPEERQEVLREYLSNAYRVVLVQAVQMACTHLVHQSLLAYNVQVCRLLAVENPQALDHEAWGLARQQTEGAADLTLVTSGHDVAGVGKVLELIPWDLRALPFLESTNATLDMWPPIHQSMRTRVVTEIPSSITLCSINDPAILAKGTPAAWVWLVRSALALRHEAPAAWIFSQAFRGSLIDVNARTRFFYTSSITDQVAEDLLHRRHLKPEMPQAMQKRVAALRFPLGCAFDGMRQHLTLHRPPPVFAFAGPTRRLGQNPLDQIIVRMPAFDLREPDNMAAQYLANHTRRDARQQAQADCVRHQCYFLLSVCRRLGRRKVALKEFVRYPANTPSDNVHPRDQTAKTIQELMKKVFPPSVTSPLSVTFYTDDAPPPDWAEFDCVVADLDPCAFFGRAPGGTLEWILNNQTSFPIQCIPGTNPNLIREAVAEEPVAERQGYILMLRGLDHWDRSMTANPPPAADVQEAWARMVERHQEFGTIRPGRVKTYLLSPTAFTRFGTRETVKQALMDGILYPGMDLAVYVRVPRWLKQEGEEEEGEKKEGDITMMIPGGDAERMDNHDILTPLHINLHEERILTAVLISVFYCAHRKGLSAIDFDIPATVSDTLLVRAFIEALRQWSPVTSRWMPMMPMASTKMALQTPVTYIRFNECPAHLVGRLQGAVTAHGFQWVEPQGRLDFSHTLIQRYIDVEGMRMDEYVLVNAGLNPFIKFVQMEESTSLSNDRELIDVEQYTAITPLGGGNHTQAPTLETLLFHRLLSKHALVDLGERVRYETLRGNTSEIWEQEVRHMRRNATKPAFVESTLTEEEVVLASLLTVSCVVQVKTRADVEVSILVVGQSGPRLDHSMMFDAAVLYNNPPDPADPVAEWMGRYYPSRIPEFVSQRNTAPFNLIAYEMRFVRQTLVLMGVLAQRRLNKQKRFFLVLPPIGLQHMRAQDRTVAQLAQIRAILTSLDPGLIAGVQLSGFTVHAKDVSAHCLTRLIDPHTTPTTASNDFQLSNGVRVLLSELYVHPIDIPSEFLAHVRAVVVDREPNALPGNELWLAQVGDAPERGMRHHILTQTVAGYALCGKLNPVLANATPILLQTEGQHLHIQPTLQTKLPVLRRSLMVVGFNQVLETARATCATGPNTIDGQLCRLEAVRAYRADAGMEQNAGLDEQITQLSSRRSNGRRRKKRMREKVQELQRTVDQLRRERDVSVARIETSRKEVLESSLDLQLHLGQRFRTLSSAEQDQALCHLMAERVSAMMVDAGAGDADQTRQRLIGMCKIPASRPGEEQLNDEVQVIREQQDAMQRFSQDVEQKEGLDLDLIQKLREAMERQLSRIGSQAQALQPQTSAGLSSWIQRHLAHQDKIKEEGTLLLEMTKAQSRLTQAEESTRLLSTLHTTQAGLLSTRTQELQNLLYRERELSRKIETFESWKRMGGTEMVTEEDTQWAARAREELGRLTVTRRGQQQQQASLEQEAADAAHRLQLQVAEQEALERRIEVQRASYGAVQDALRGLRGMLGEVGVEVESRRTRVDQLDMGVTRLEQEQGEWEERFGRLQDHVNGVDGRRQQMDMDFKATTTQLERAEGELAKTNSELERQGEVLTDLTTRGAPLQTRADEASRRAQITGREVESLRQEVRGLEEGGVAVSQEHERLKSEVETLQQRMRELQESRETGERASAEAETRRADVERELKEAREATAAEREKLRRLTERLRSVSSRLRNAGKDYDTELREAEGRGKILLERHLALQQELEKTRHQSGEAQGQLQSLRDKIGQTQAEAEKASRQAAELRERLMASRADLERQNRDLSTQVQDAQGDVNLLTERKSELEASLSGLLTQLGAQQEDYKSKTELLQTTEAQLAAAQERLRGVETQISETEGRLASARTLLRNTETQAVKARDELADLQKQLQTAKDDTQRQEEQHRQQVAQGEARVAELTRQQSELQDLIARLRKGQHEIVEVRSRVTDELQQVTKDRDTALEKLQATRRELDTQQARLEEARGEVANAEARQDELRQRTTGMEQGLAATTTRLDNIKAELAQTQTQLHKTREELTARRDELDNLRKTLGDVEASLSSRRDELGQYEARTHSALVAAREAEGKVREQAQTLQELQEQRAEVGRAVQQAVEERNRLAAEVAQTQETLAAQNAALDESRVELEQIRQAKEAASADIGRLEADLRKRKQELESMTANRDNVARDLAILMTDMESKRDTQNRLREDIEQLQQTKAMVQREWRTSLQFKAEGEIKQLREQVRTLKGSLESERAEKQALAKQAAAAPAQPLILEPAPPAFSKPVEQTVVITREFIEFTRDPSEFKDQTGAGVLNNLTQALLLADGVREVPDDAVDDYKPDANDIVDTVSSFNLPAIADWWVRSGLKNSLFLKAWKRNLLGGHRQIIRDQVAAMHRMLGMVPDRQDLVEVLAKLDEALAGSRFIYINPGFVKLRDMIRDAYQAKMFLSKMVVVLNHFTSTPTSPNSPASPDLPDQLTKSENHVLEVQGEKRRFGPYDMVLRNEQVSDLIEYLKTIMNTRSILVYGLGYSGSGKTTILNRLLEELGANVVRIGIISAKVAFADHLVNPKKGLATQVDELLRRTMSIMPTFNNPQSSRAAVCYQLELEGHTSILMDLPGHEDAAELGTDLITRLRESPKGLLAQLQKLTTQSTAGGRTYAWWSAPLEEQALTGAVKWFNSSDVQAILTDTTQTPQDALQRLGQMAKTPAARAYRTQVENFLNRLVETSRWIDMLLKVVTAYFKTNDHSTNSFSTMLKNAGVGTVYTPSFTRFLNFITNDLKQPVPIALAVLRSNPVDPTMSIHMLEFAQEFGREGPQERDEFYRPRMLHAKAGAEEPTQEGQQEADEFTSLQDGAGFAMMGADALFMRKIAPNDSELSFTLTFKDGRLNHLHAMSGGKCLEDKCMVKPCTGAVCAHTHPRGNRVSSADLAAALYLHPANGGKRRISIVLGPSGLFMYAPSKDLAQQWAKASQEERDALQASWKDLGFQHQDAAQKGRVEGLHQRLRQDGWFMTYSPWTRIRPGDVLLMRQ